MATQDGKIYITISDRRIGEDGGEVTTQNYQAQSENNKNIVGDFFKHKFFNLVESQARQIVSYTIGNIGNFTGDYQRQREMETAVNLVNMGINLGTSFATGTIATGSPVGGLVAVGIMVASQTINIATQEYANRVSNRNQNYNIQQLKDISGLNALTNGSR